MKNTPFFIAIGIQCDAEIMQSTPRLWFPAGFKERVAIQFDQRASVYDSRSAGYHAPLATKLLKIAKLAPGEHVLDAATGTGIVAALAAPEVLPDGGSVFGVDISPAMILQARRKVEEGQVTNATFICADLDSFQCDDESFDAILCSSALVFLPDVGKSLGKWHEWLRGPHGRAVFNAPKGRASAAFGLYTDLVLKYGGPVLKDPSEEFATEESTIKLLHSAGYSVVEVQETVEGMSYPGMTSQEHASSMWGACSANPFAPLESWLPEASKSTNELKREFIDACSRLGDGLKGQDGVIRDTHTMLWVVARK